MCDEKPTPTWRYRSMLRTLKVSALVTTVAAAPLHATAAIGPHSVSYTLNGDCNGYSAHVTVQAVELTEDDLNKIQRYKWFGVSHLHSNGIDSYGYQLTRPFYKTGLARVDEINNSVFSTPTPELGRTTTMTVNHDGVCPPPDGYECVGLLLGMGESLPWDIANGRPPSLGACVRIPSPTGSCWFTTIAATKDLGTVLGEATSKMSLQYKCDGAPPDYTVRLDGGGSSVRDGKAGVSVELTVEGKPLPYTMVKPSPGQRNLELGLAVIAEPGSSGQFSAQGVLVIEPK